MNKPQSLQPFIKYCMTIGEIPTSYMNSMTYQEQLIWFCNFLQNKVIPVVNNNSEVVKELQEWFINLDVQDEVNNKIDEMYESGQLQEIIIEYLQLSGLLVYENVNAMKNATNLISGSLIETFGFYTAGDGGQAKYKVREVLTTDTVDEVFIFALHDPSLIAELIEENSFLNSKTLGLKGDKTTNETSKLQYVIDKAKEKNKALYIDGYIYVTSTINTKALEIFGKGNNPAGSDTFKDMGWDYLRNQNEGANVTFDEYVEEMLTTGSGIISDTATPILSCYYEDGNFNLHDICICGWLRNSSQNGLQSYYSTSTYLQGAHKFNNVSVINCGNDGVHINSLELTKIENNHFNYNFGYGLNIVGVNGVDTPTEYAKIIDCDFTGNKKGGINIENTFRKELEINNCNLSRSGLYKQLGDTIPVTLADIKAGLKISGVESSQTALAKENLTIINCFGEELPKLLDIRNSDVLNNIDIHNHLNRIMCN